MGERKRESLRLLLLLLPLGLRLLDKGFEGGCRSVLATMCHAEDCQPYICGVNGSRSHQIYMGVSSELRIFFLVSEKGCDCNLRKQTNKLKLGAEEKEKENLGRKKIVLMLLFTIIYEIYSIFVDVTVTYLKSIFLK
jgi:hypothetical protein